MSIQQPYRWRDLPRLLAALFLMCLLYVVVSLSEKIGLYWLAISTCNTALRIESWGVGKRRKR